MKNTSLLYFVLILLIASFFRLWRLSNLPSGLNWDEISHGYNSYSILKTGKDQWGYKFPLFNFRAYGDYPTTANIYFTIPFIYFLGLNAFSIRLPAALLGIIFVIFSYFFAKVIFNSPKISLFVMFLAAISPWSLFPSRAVFQSNLAQLFTLMALFYFFSGLKKPALFIISSIFFILSTFSYHNSRIIVPIVVPLLIIFNLPSFRKIFPKHRIKLSLSLIIFLLISVLNIINLFSKESFARNRWVGIINPSTINIINENRRLFNGSPILGKLFYNKVTYLVPTFIQNYINLFNPLPIFFYGSENFQFNPPKTGLFYSIFLPFFYLGFFYFLYKSKNNSQYLCLLFTFLIFLIPAALTVGDFPSIRATIALPFYFLFISLGISLINFKTYNFLPLSIIIISIIQFSYYWKNYLTYNQKFSQVWQYGYQEAVDLIKSKYSNYNQIYITKFYGEPHEFVLFYWPWDPQKYQSDPYLNWDYHSDWYWVNAFDKFKFVNDWEIKNLTPQRGTLLLTSPNNYPKLNAKIVDTIKFLDNSIAFDLISYD